MQTIKEKPNKKLDGFLTAPGESKKVAPQITVSTNSPIVETENFAGKTNITTAQNFRFAENEYLLYDLNSAFQVFDISNEAANQFFIKLLKYGEQCEATGAEMICFCQPSIDAYRSELKLCNTLESANSENLQSAFDDFIETHTLGVSLGVWMQERDAPLWRANVYHNGEIVESAICNAVQTAIFCGYWSAKNPEYKTEIKRA